MVQVHRCRFIDWTPSAISALSFTPHQPGLDPKLAVGRNNGDIEIWDPRCNWIHESTIPGGTNMTVEALAWAHQDQLSASDIEFYDEDERSGAIEKLRMNPPRLFAAGTSSVITEWDWSTLQIKRQVHSNGGAIWAMATSPSQMSLAIGCEDGGVRLYNIADDELEFVRIFDRQRSRILSLSWSPEEKDGVLVTGSADSSLRKWTVETGRVIHKMDVDRHPGKQTFVWTVVVLSNGIIASGDSTGTVRFWDSKMGTQMDVFNSHGADVLCLAASKDGSTVYSAGIDLKTVQYKLVCSQQEKRWVMTIGRRFHTHDIRAMAIFEWKPIDALVTGGVDMGLVVVNSSNFADSNARRIPYIPQRPVIKISRRSRMLLSPAQGKKGKAIMKLWKIDSLPEKSDILNGKLDPVAVNHPNYSLMAKLKLTTYRNVTSTAISDDGSWVAITTMEEVKLFRLNQDGNQVTIHKIRDFPQSYVKDDEHVGALHIVFTPDSTKIIIATSKSYVAILDLRQSSEGIFPVLRIFSQHRVENHDNISTQKMQVDNNTIDDLNNEETIANINVSIIKTLSVSDDGQWLVSGDVLNRIHVYNLDVLQHTFTLPRFNVPHTNAKFHLTSGTLVVTLANNEVHIYNVESKRRTEWSTEYSSRLPKHFLRLQDKIIGIASNPSSPHHLYIWGTSWLCKVDLTSPVSADTTPFLKRKHWNNGDDKRVGMSDMMGDEIIENGDCKKDSNLNACNSNFNIITRFQSMMLVDFVSEDEMVIIERPFFAIAPSLPPSYYRPRYNT